MLLLYCCIMFFFIFCNIIYMLPFMCSCTYSESFVKITQTCSRSVKITTFMWIGLYYLCWRINLQCHSIYQMFSIVLCTFGVMAAGRGVGLGSGCLTVGMWDCHVCFCVHARADCGRCASVHFAPSAQFGCILYTCCIYCIYI